MLLLDPPLQRTYLVPFTDWAHNAHTVLFEQAKNAHYVSAQSVKGIRVIHEIVYRACRIVR